ncbi:MAG: hypothetical protein KAH96_06525, partial [Alphaproteobacteria bacterium]|nr:hypothetical protein [Alphaproteobacteria bacterium]
SIYQYHVVPADHYQKRSDTHIIPPPALTVHLDFNHVFFQNICKIKARKLTALIGVKNFWTAVQSQRFFLPSLYDGCMNSVF